MQKKKKNVLEVIDTATQGFDTALLVSWTKLSSSKRDHNYAGESRVPSDSAFSLSTLITFIKLFFFSKKRKNYLSFLLNRNEEENS